MCALGAKEGDVLPVPGMSRRFWCNFGPPPPDSHTISLLSRIILPWDVFCLSVSIVRSYCLVSSSRSGLFRFITSSHLAALTLAFSPPAVTHHTHVGPAPTTLPLLVHGAGVISIPAWLDCAGERDVKMQVVGGRCLGPRLRHGSGRAGLITSQLRPPFHPLPSWGKS